MAALSGPGMLRELKLSLGLGRNQRGARNKCTGGFPETAGGQCSVIGRFDWTLTHPTPLANMEPVVTPVFCMCLPSW